MTKGSISGANFGEQRARILDRSNMQNPVKKSKEGIPSARSDTFVLNGEEQRAAECELPTSIQALFSKAPKIDKALPFPSYVHDRAKIDVWGQHSPIPDKNTTEMRILQRGKGAINQADGNGATLMASVVRSPAGDGNYVILMHKPAHGRFDSDITWQDFLRAVYAAELQLPPSEACGGPTSAE